MPRLAPRSPVESPPHSVLSRSLVIALLVGVAVAGCRLWLAESLPLTDTTEARFGEMARKMVETGDWVTPQHDYGVPYLAKPPLAIWVAALGIEVLGDGELGPRALIFAVALGFCGLFFAYARRELGTHAAAAGVLILASSLVFFVSMAAVMTDMVLTACVSTALFAFWRRYHRGSAGWEVTFFAALGLGLLAKGPLAALLIGVPIVAWAIACGYVRATLARLAWGKGLALAALVAVPWYLIAESRNPGFLYYFIVGEHLQRFLVPGWSGDLYGYAHEVPRGTIWLYFLIGALPWSLLLPVWLFVERGAVRRNWQARRELVVFALAAAATPLALFTFSGNIILVYVLYAIPPAVLAVVALLAETLAAERKLVVLACAAAVAVVAPAALVAANAPFVARHTQKFAIAAIRSQPLDASVPIYYWRKRYFSADYYSRGAARVLTQRQPLEDELAAQHAFYLVVAAGERDELPEDLAAQLRLLGEVAGTALYAPSYAAVRAARSGGA